VRLLVTVFFAGALLGWEAKADVPRVAADIGPVHGLLSRVMDGVGQPTLIIRSDASPHAYALRPSEASALESAELMFWIGPKLTPWLADPIEKLATNAQVIELLEADGTVLHAFRADAAFEDSDGEEPRTQGSHTHNHDHDGIDPHAWLDPDNAKLWLDVMAVKLAGADPENSTGYLQNAKQGKAEIEAAQARLAEALATSDELSFLVYHDAYQYAERRLGVLSAGAIVPGDASNPGPARIAELRNRMRLQGIACVIAEPQFNAALVAAVLEGFNTPTVILDPLGAEIPPGPDFYPALMDDVALAFHACGI